MEDNEITHSVENRSLKAVNNNPIEPIKALSKKVIHPGYEDNNFRTFCHDVLCPFFEKFFASSKSSS